jgi:terminase large subunit-like protein
VHAVSASRGKVLRAEPVSALYEQGLVHHVGRFAVLEDQLCAFTTAGYRGEGSPDHADALVFAITDLLLNEPAAIIEFYRMRAGEERSSSAQVGTKTADRMIGLRAPEGISGAHGISGAFYIIGDDRVIAVKPEDAAALTAAGFTRVAEQKT